MDRNLQAQVQINKKKKRVLNCKQSLHLQIEKYTIYKETLDNVVIAHIFKAS